MRLFTRAALALALLGSTAGFALAQDVDGDRSEHEARFGQPRGEPQPGPRSDTPAPRQAREVPALGGRQADGDGRDWRGSAPGRVDVPPPPPVIAAREGHDGDRMEGRSRGQRYDNPGNVVRDEGRFRGGRDDHDVRRGGNWDDRHDWSWRDRDRDDWHWRSPNRYFAQRYRPPVGFYDHTWMLGELLPSSWWIPQYRIDLWWSYDLPRPPAGFQWIRVRHDAFLIERQSGRVFQIVYDLFW